MHTLTHGFQAYSLTTGNTEVSESDFHDTFWIGNILKLIFSAYFSPDSCVCSFHLLDLRLLAPHPHL